MSDWILPIGAAVSALALGSLAVVNKLTTLPNNLNAVQRPRELQSVQLNGEMLSAPLLYLPPSNCDVTDPNIPVSIIIPGNPGIAEFYVDMMTSQHAKANGRIHIYTLGHLGHGSVLDEEKIPSTETSPTLPTFPLDEKYSSIPHPDRLFSLREVIAHKLSVLTAIRLRHKYADFIWSGHSMGSFIILTVLRAIDDMSSLILNGTILEPIPTTITEVERGMPDTKFIPSNNTSLRSEIVRITFSEDELKQWFDLVDPNHTLRTTAKKQNGTLAQQQQQQLQKQTLVSGEDEEKKGSGVDDEESLEPLTLERILTSEQHDGASFIKQIQFLFPTIQRIADTPNGWDLQTPYTLARDGHAFTFTRLLTRLPQFILRGLLSIKFSNETEVITKDTMTDEYWNEGDENAIQYTNIKKGFTNQGSNTAMSACLLMLHSDSLSNALNLFKDEVETIRVLDLPILKRHAHRIHFYFTKTDGWAPEYQAQHVQYIYSQFKKEDIPTGEIIIDTFGLEHAFCTSYKGSKIIGEFCWDKAKNVLSQQ